LKYKMHILLLVLCFSITFAVAQDRPQSDTQREETEQTKLLQEGAVLLRTKKAQDAVSIFEKVIAYYESKHRGGAVQIYCANNQVEALFYLTKHATQNPKIEARIVRIWCDAQFLKAYALVELGRVGDAQSALEAAIALAPANSQYLSELGNIYLRQKNWVKALETYIGAEEAAQFSDPQIRQSHLAKAHRGVGYALIELGRLDEAEAKYRQSIQIDPNEKLARNQLEYIRQLRVKRGIQ